jgi:hypothetical protein
LKTSERSWAVFFCSGRSTVTSLAVCACAMASVGCCDLAPSGMVRLRIPRIRPAIGQDYFEVKWHHKPPSWMACCTLDSSLGTTAAQRFKSDCVPAAVRGRARFGTFFLCLLAVFPTDLSIVALPQLRPRRAKRTGAIEAIATRTGARRWHRPETRREDKLAVRLPESGSRFTRQRIELCPTC